MSLVENAVKLDEFHAGDQLRRDAEVVVCTSARVTYQKAPWRFTRLAQKLSAHSNARFRWFGDGEADAVERWIDRRAVEMSGWIPAAELRQRLLQCDIFVLPSLWEGMPIALIEAQASGLPAVASRIVGNRDIIVHGITGFLANDDDELERYTRQLIDDAPLRQRMGAAARAHARARFADTQSFRSYVGVYRRLLTPMQRRRPQAVSHLASHEVLK
jgi:glycosyltransferase involved in cell wall biosynthesis